MGFDAKAKLIMGVKLTHKIDKNTKTKYNEDTGKPYEHVEKVPRFYIGDKVLSDADMIFENCDDKLLYADYENKDSYFIGVVFTETGWCGLTDDGGPYSEVEQVNRVNAEQQCKKYLEENGFEIETFLIKEYLIHDVSY